MPPRARLTLAFLLLVFLPGLLVSVVLSRLYLGVLSESASRQTAEVVDQVSQNIRGEVDAVSILVAALYQDRELRSLADSFALTKDPGRRLLISNRLDDKMAGFFNYTNRVGAVVLFLRGGAVYYDRNNSTIGSITGIDRSVYAPARAEPGKVYLFDTLAGLAPVGADGYLLTVAVCPTPQEGGTQLDAVVVTFRVPYFDRLVARPSASGRDVVIFGRGGQAILSSLPAGTEIDAVRPAGPGADARGPREVTIGGRPWLASPLRMESTGWTIVFLTDKSVLTRRITAYQWYLYPALGLLTLLFVLYEEISRREDQRRERQRMKAELDALRFQIDPHFVANTLNSIRLMARASRADAIADMTQSLLRILADSRAGDGSMVELGREMATVESYVGIMRVRFGQHFDVEYDISDAAGGDLLLRMILQPVVENAILHGIADARKRGRIRISAREETRARLPAVALTGHDSVSRGGACLVVEVSDDGVGMDAAKVREALVPPAEGEHDAVRPRRIGLANVQRRIRLNFGEPFGLFIESAPGAGTTVRFCLPVIRRAEVKRA